MATSFHRAVSANRMMSSEFGPGVGTIASHSSVNAARVDVSSCTAKATPQLRLRCPQPPVSNHSRNRRLEIWELCVGRRADSACTQYDAVALWLGRIELLEFLDQLAHARRQGGLNDGADLPAQACSDPFC